MGDEFVRTDMCQAVTKRLDDKIASIENISDEIHSLSLSVAKLATTIEYMVQEADDHAKRLEAIEMKDGSMWRDVIKYTVTAVIGIFIGFVFKNLGIF